MILSAKALRIEYEERARKRNANDVGESCEYQHGYTGRGQPGCAPEAQLKLAPQTLWSLPQNSVFPQFRAL